MRVVSESEYIAAMDRQVKFKNGTFGLIIDRYLFWSMDSKKASALLSSFKIIDDDFIQIPVTFYTHSATVIWQSLNKFILECHQHGFCQHIQSKSLFLRRPKPLKTGPQILTMSKLSAGFFVWLASVLVALIIFLCEHLVSYVNTKE